MSNFQMPARLERCVAPIQMFARRLFGDKSGVAAIEFGFIAPLMFMMLVGTVELAQLITVDRRVTVVASTTADLVAREQTINKAGIDVVMQIVGVLFAPYETPPLKVELIAVGALETALTNTKTCWSYAHQLGSTAPKVRNAVYSLPTGILSASNPPNPGVVATVIVAEVSYTYTPLIFSSFVQGAFPLSDKFYLKPRLGNIRYTDETGTERKYNDASGCQFP
jgi:Flp pilus assembly protein TadG